jgi:hypothetical protein
VRCSVGCALFGRPYRPEEEGGDALLEGEIGLDVIASVAQRFGEHRSVSEIHAALRACQLEVCERSVINLSRAVSLTVCNQMSATGCDGSFASASRVRCCWRDAY